MTALRVVAPYARRPAAAARGPLRGTSRCWPGLCVRDTWTAAASAGRCLHRSGTSPPACARQRRGGYGEFPITGIRWTAGLCALPGRVPGGGRVGGVFVRIISVVGGHLPSESSQPVETARADSR